MRLVNSVLCGLFLSAILAGCGGGTSTTTPPENLPPGPPPGTSADAVKITPKK